MKHSILHEKNNTPFPSELRFPTKKKHMQLIFSPVSYFDVKWCLTCLNPPHGSSARLLQLSKGHWMGILVSSLSISGECLTLSWYLASGLTLRACCKHTSDCLSSLHIYWESAAESYKLPRSLRGKLPTDRWKCFKCLWYVFIRFTVFTSPKKKLWHWL